MMTTKTRVKTTTIGSCTNNNRPTRVNDLLKMMDWTKLIYSTNKYPETVLHWNLQRYFSGSAYLLYWWHERKFPPIRIPIANYYIGNTPSNNIAAYLPTKTPPRTAPVPLTTPYTEID